MEKLLKNLRFSDKSLLYVIQTWDDAPFYYYNNPTATMIRFRPSGAESGETLPVAPQNRTYPHVFGTDRRSNCPNPAGRSHADNQYDDPLRKNPVLRHDDS